MQKKMIILLQYNNLLNVKKDLGFCKGNDLHYCIINGEFFSVTIIKVSFYIEKH